MARLEDHFIILRDFGVAVCVSCEYAVRPDQIASHLRGKKETRHKPTTFEERAELQASALRSTELAQRLEDIRYPDPTDDPIECLPTFGNRLRCLQPECTQLHLREDDMRSHVKQVHGFTARSIGIHQSNVGPLWASNVIAQRFFVQSTWHRVFEVCRSTNPTGDEAQQVEYDNETRTLDAAQFAIASQQYESERGDVRFHDPWRRACAFDTHIKTRDMEALAIFTRAPKIQGRPKSNLETVTSATRTMLLNAFQKSCDGDAVPVHALKIVNGAVDGHGNAFNGDYLTSTRNQYAGVWARIMAYVWQLHFWSDQPERRGIEHPPFTLCGAQVPRMTKLITQVDLATRGKNQPEDLEQELLAFCIELIRHELNGSVFDSAIVSAVAAISISRDHQGFKSAFSTTPMLAAITSGAKALVLYYAWYTAGTSDESFEALSTVEGSNSSSLNSLGLAHVVPAGPDMIDITRDLTVQYLRAPTLTEGRFSPISHLKTLLDKGRDICFTSPREGSIIWQGESVGRRDIMFSMTALRTMVHTLFAQAAHRLRREILLAPNANAHIPQLRLDSLWDDWTRVDAGTSFLTLDHNHAQVGEGRRWLWQRVRNEPALVRSWVHDGSTPLNVPSLRAFECQPQYPSKYAAKPKPLSADLSPRAVPTASPQSCPPTRAWKLRRVAKWLAAVKLFKEELLILVHLTSGAPARGTELVSIRHRNGKNGDSEQRGVFIDEGTLVLKTMYHKGYRKTEKPKPVYRYLPREVGQLLAQYLWLVEPFINELKALDGVMDCNVHTGTYIWEPAVEGSSSDFEDTGIDDDELADALGEEHDQVVDVHDRAQQQYHNPDGWWHTQRMTAVMRRLCLQLHMPALSVSTWRHFYIAIHMEYPQQPGVESLLRMLREQDGELVSSGEQVASAVSAQQAGHTESIRQTIYARPVYSDTTAVQATRKKFFAVSEDWHRFLHFDSVVGRIATLPTTVQAADGLQTQWAKEQVKRQKQLRAANFEKKFAECIDVEGATLSFGQRTALEHIKAGASPILVVLGTGGGKSMIFMLPALVCPGGVTVVVVPLVALRQNMGERCGELGINFFEWEGEDYYRADQANIVLVTPEATQTAPFADFMRRTSARRCLDRIVVDEAHTILDASGGYRPELVQLRRLVLYGAPMIWMTATLPPSEYFDFRKRAGFGTGIDIAEVRLSTNRQEIAYSMVDFDAADEDAAIQSSVRTVVNGFSSQEEQLVVYCDTVAETERVASLVGGTAYHASLPSSERYDIYSAFAQGDIQILAATTAFSLGVNIETIRTVIHFKAQRRSLRDFAQESGRAGRDGRVSQSIVLRACDSVEDKLVPCDVSRRIAGGALGLLAAFEDDSRCRRDVLCQYLDGHPHEKCAPEEASCDVCADARLQDLFAQRDVPTSQCTELAPDAEHTSDLTEMAGLQVHSDRAASPAQPMPRQAMSPAPPPPPPRSSPKKGELKRVRTATVTAAASGSPSKRGCRASTSMQQPPSVPRQQQPASTAPTLARTRERVVTFPAAEPPKAHFIFKSATQVLAEPRPTQGELNIRAQQAENTAEDAKQAQYLIRLEQTLRYFEGGDCVVCLAGRSAEDACGHSLENCHKADAIARFRTVQSALVNKNKLHFQNYACSWHCFAPQAACGMWTWTGSGNGHTWNRSGSCAYSKQLVCDVAAALLSREGGEEMQWLQQQAGAKPGDWSKMQKYIESKVGWDAASAQSSGLCTLIAEHAWCGQEE